MPRSHVTIRDVAHRAGVSHQTVSRVINGNERVSPETRTRVETAIDELGYRPNAMARSMARGRSGVLACIAPNLTDYTFASMIDGAEREARLRGYFLLSASAPDEETFAALVDELVTSRRAEGMIVINPYQDGRFQHLPQNHPIVFAGARPRAETTNSVALDDENAARLATQHLLDLGHHQIGCITGPMSEDCSQDRSDGYKSALTDAAISYNPAIIIEGDWSARSGYDALMQLAQEGRIPRAIFAQNDQMAVGALRAARDLGLQVPDQLSVIGIDDIPLAAYFEPPLTTFRQDFARMGTEAVRLLIGSVENPDMPRRQMRLPAQLILRQSTTPASE
ncbi:MAG: LacI family DNA-binding transcriptional regulator [Ardenticatenaceae bacterium]|nr:LacI family DNA-binding transcriptional regulator [Ardenticatenaceae bacterium]MCB9444870.1 LacI family DNA-binding transcriptional regulator [Ardenticatenaceae bacterium]